MKFFFHGLVFIAFGLGVTLAQTIQNMSNGLYFLGLGFLLIIISVITKEIEYSLVE